MQSRFLVLIGLGFISSLAFSQVKGPLKSDVPAAIKAYFGHLDRVFQSGSSMADVEALLAVCNQDVRYIHRNYSADFNRETWLQAFARNMKRGAYKKPVNSCSVITRSIPGKDYYAVEYAFGTMVDGQCQPKDDKRYLVLFKVENEKISLIEELW